MKILKRRLTGSHKVPSIGRRGELFQHGERAAVKQGFGFFHYPTGLTSPSSHKTKIVGVFIITSILSVRSLIHNVCPCLCFLCLGALSLLSITVPLYVRTGGDRCVRSLRG